MSLDRIREFLQGLMPNDEFIWWLFKGRCVMCGQAATEINEIVPRARTKNALEWHNRVTLCNSCHRQFHDGGVTDEKMIVMKIERDSFLRKIGRKEYV